MIVKDDLFFICQLNVINFVNMKFRNGGHVSMASCRVQILDFRIFTTYYEATELIISYFPNNNSNIA